MRISLELLLVTSSVGALQSAFFGIYLFTLKKGRYIANVLLGLLLLAFAVRVFKSVGYFFSEGHIIPDLLMNFGFGCNLAILPLLWLYLNAFIKQEYQYEWKRDSLHLIPSVFALALSPFLTDHFWMGQYGYTISLFSVLAYLPFCIHLIAKHFNTLNKVQKMWVLSLTVGVTVVWSGYLANFVFGLVSYITAPVLFSILVYFLSFLGLKEGALFVSDNKYQSSRYSPAQIEACFAALQQLLVTAQPFRNASLTLPKLASQLGVSANLLSETINKRAGLNFSDFINSYRIREAQVLLEKPEYDHQKIATIAYETGFNSLSVFNTAFKKFTSVTPSAYRKTISKR